MCVFIYIYIHTKRKRERYKKCRLVLMLLGHVLLSSFRLHLFKEWLFAASAHPPLMTTQNMED